MTPVFVDVDSLARMGEQIGNVREALDISNPVGPPLVLNRPDGLDAKSFSADRM
jgi:hypothetical protein